MAPFLLVGDGGAASSDNPDDDGWAESEHVHRLEFVLHNARDVEAVARGVLSHLLALPHVSRVGLALTEGAGRRLRFVASESLEDGALVWCHIDAYDDVPLTAVTRSGEAVHGNLDELEARFPGIVARQREKGTKALATLPLPGLGPPMGGLMLFFDADQEFGEAQLRVLDTAARRTGEAVRRVRSDALGTGPTAGGPSLGDAGRHAELELDADPRAAGMARRFLRDHLTEWGVDEAITDTAQLCLSELVNNVIMHAHATSELALHLDDSELSVVLKDRGGAQPPVDTPTRPSSLMTEDELIVAGRGLVLVDALVDRWGTERNEVGTTAWFMLDVRDAVGPAQTG